LKGIDWEELKNLSPFFHPIISKGYADWAQ
jgi:hypothetical protein